MASAFTHAIFAAALGTVMTPERRSWIALGALCAVIPDADVLAFRFGIPYAHPLGHRGLSHSLAFAACSAAVLTWAGARRDGALPVMRVGAYLFAIVWMPALALAAIGVAWRRWAPSRHASDGRSPE